MLIREWLTWPRVPSLTERLDGPGVDQVHLREALRDLARVNQLFGGTRLALSYLRHRLRTLPRRPLRVLDVATGGADIPAAMARWCRQQGISMMCAAIDHSESILTAARHRTRDCPELRFAAADALHLPYADRTFDLALASLVLHHLSFDQGVRLIRELARVSGGHFVVNDLLRSRTAYVLTWLGMRLFCRSRIVWYDGPVSIRRAYTRLELEALVRATELSGIRIRAHPLFRVTLVGGINGAA
ncbi:MAG: methyltransferase domain-containing protein [Candidatus Methylomirabilales bacterium]